LEKLSQVAIPTNNEMRLIGEQGGEDAVEWLYHRYRIKKIKPRSKAYQTSSRMRAVGGLAGIEVGTQLGHDFLPPRLRRAPAHAHAFGPRCVELFLLRLKLGAPIGESCLGDLGLQLDPRVGFQLQVQLRAARLLLVECVR